ASPAGAPADQARRRGLTPPGRAAAVGAARRSNGAMRATLERVVKLEPHGRFALPELPGEPLEPRLFTSPTTARRRGASAAAAACFGGGSRRGSRAGSSSCRRDGPRGELAPLLAVRLRYGSVEPVATRRARRSGVGAVAGEHGPRTWCWTPSTSSRTATRPAPLVGGRLALRGGVATGP